MELLGSMRRAMLKTLSPRRSASEIIRRSYSLQSKRAGMEPASDLVDGWAPWERLQKLLNQRAQRSGRGRLDVFLIRGEHAFESVDGGEDNFGELLPVREPDLRGENVLQFVCNFTELRKTASGGKSPLSV